MIMHAHRGTNSTGAFTLIELMIGLVILGVLATIAIPAYQNFIEEGKAQLCEQNLQALKKEWDVYIVEHNVVPGDISQLPREGVDNAFAEGMRTAGWKAKFALFVEEQQERGAAFASLVEELAKGNSRMLFCPSDTRRDRLVSYGSNASLGDMTKDFYMNNTNDTMRILSDSFNTTFSETNSSSIPKRHRIRMGITPTPFANVITKGGWVEKVSSGTNDQSAKVTRAQNTILSDTKKSNAIKRKEIQGLWKSWLQYKD
jgi:prepilin-type N-terminal cleavage/methylation domain-containing protein